MQGRSQNNLPAKDLYEVVNIYQSNILSLSHPFRKLQNYYRHREEHILIYMRSINAMRQVHSRIIYKIST